MRLFGNFQTNDFNRLIIDVDIKEEYCLKNNITDHLECRLSEEHEYATEIAEVMILSNTQRFE